jgi:hypothetical protein
MFNDLCIEQEESIFSDEHLIELLTFVQSNGINEFELMLDECEITSEHVWFAFGKDLEQPNESTNYVATANYCFKYDINKEEFTQCYYEQG